MLDIALFVRPHVDIVVALALILAGGLLRWSVGAVARGLSAAARAASKGR